MQSSRWKQPAPTAVEVMAHAVLRFVGDHPAKAGRLRIARILTGRPVPPSPLDDPQAYDPYQVATELTLQEAVGLIDALIEAALIATSAGRPMLTLTRAGHRALDALEAVGWDPPDTRELDAVRVLHDTTRC